MGLLSLLKSKSAPPGAGPAGAAGEEVERARTRARQRLIGAVVLVGVGIVGFPLLFETHPRPIPVDIPIEIANRDKAPPLVMPPARPNAASGTAGAGIITENASEAGREVPAPVETPPEAPVRPPVAAAEPRKPDGAASAGKPGSTAKSATATAGSAKPPAAAASATAADAARARALLDGKDGKDGKDGTKLAAAKPDEAASAGRFVVQVGAFAEANAARETRQKVEKLGLKTYTQVVDTSAGSRIRVRVGPFGSREEADKAAGKLKSAGLSAALLVL